MATPEAHDPLNGIPQEIRDCFPTATELLTTSPQFANIVHQVVGQALERQGIEHREPRAHKIFLTSTLATLETLEAILEAKKKIAAREASTEATPSE